jgi:hypothetical protein
MSYCTPCPPCDTNFPLLCEPLETTANGKRLVVEDSAACQKTLASPSTPSTLTWDNGLKWISNTPENQFNQFTNFVSTGSTAARNLVTRFSDIVNVKDFGAVGDGVANDTAAIQAAVNYAGQSKKVYIPAGTYYCASSITSNLATSFSGDGISETILLFNGNGIILSPSNDNASSEINNISFHKKIGSVSGTAITYNGSSQISGGGIQDRSSPRFYFNNISIKGEGDSTNSGFLNGIEIISSIHGIIDGLHFDGMSPSQSSPQSSKAISITGSGSGAEFLISNTWGFGCQYGIYIQDQEGIFISNCNFIVVKYGIWVEAPSGGEPQLNVTNCHINANSTCIFASRQSQSNISNNLLYLRESATSNGVGIALDISAYSIIHSNIIVNTSLTYSIDGIVCTNDCTGTYIHNNTFQNGSTGVWLKPSAFGAYVGINNFVSVNTNILNQGSSNKIGVYHNEKGSVVSTSSPILIQRNGVDSYAITAEGCVEAGRLNQAQTTFIDFHTSGNSSNDYDVRIACDGGNASNGNGKIFFVASICEFPSISTTVNAANAYLDSSSSNSLLRSSSSIKYKKDIELVDQQYSENVLKLKPVWYRSKCEADNSEWSYWGLIAEDVEKIDPRLVSYGYDENDYKEVKIINSNGAEETKVVLKKDAVKKPMGVQYDRVPVLMLDIIKKQQKQIEELSIKVSALESK